MTTQELIDQTKAFCAYDQDLYQGETPTDAQVVSALNWAQRIIARKIYLYDPKITLTLTAEQDNYDLRSLSVVSRKVIKPFRVIINGNQLLTCDGRMQGLWAMSELDTYCPTWRSDTSDTPSKATFLDRKLYLHPKPTAAVVTAGNNYIAGTYLPAALSAASLATEPDLPEELHECLSYVASVRSSLPNVDSDEAWARLKAYQESSIGLIEEIAKENASQLMAWGTTSGSALGEDNLCL